MLIKYIHLPLQEEMPNSWINTRRAVATIYIARNLDEKIAVLASG
jgi:hypothetical protein